VRPGPTVRAALVLAAFLALFLAVDRIGGGGRPADGGSLARAGDTTAPSSTAPASTTTTVPPTTRAATTSVPGTSVSTLRSTKGVTVQVLNGVFVTGLAHRVADRLRAAGYQVVAANTALGNYPVSRIYYTEGHQADAVALRARFPVFQQIAPAPANLSRRVDLHVVVGKNYL
jgi:LytR cell envelope-related transcriptional attenuator